MLWLSFFCLSFCNALRSSSDSGSSFTVILSKTEPLRAVLFGFVAVVLPNWLKKSRMVLALTCEKKN